MSCALCKSDAVTPLVQFHYIEPDKYEKAAGIVGPIQRWWTKCCSCGLYMAPGHMRTYPLTVLDKVYQDFYRSNGFRGKSIHNVFEEIMALPFEKSENLQRVDWFTKNVGMQAKTVLDIGSGLGVFPAVASDYFTVTCCEANVDSVRFLKELGLDVHQGFFPDIPGFKQWAWNAISCIHVLEHVADPDAFLKAVAEHLVPGGRVFIEVPDSVEFDTLPSDHDEFNSCHLYFWNVPTLYRQVSEAGYEVTHIRRVKYEERGLSRILLLGTKR